MEKTLGNKGRWLLAGVMAAIALGVAGIRGPRDTTNSAFAQQAGESKPASAVQPSDAIQFQKVQIVPVQSEGTDANKPTGKTNVSGTFTLVDATAAVNPKRSMQFVPADSKLVIAASPSELAKLASGQKLVAAFTDDGFYRKFGIKGSDLADVQVVLRGVPEPHRVILRMVQPHDWKTATLDRAFPNLETKPFGDKGKTYYVIKDKSEMSKAGDLGPAFFTADDRTLVAGSEEDIKHVIAGDEKLMAADEFPMFAHGAIAARVDASFIQQLGGQTKQSFENNPVLAMLQPLLSQIRSATAWVGIMPPKDADSESIRVFANIDCLTAPAADQVVKVLEAARILGTNLLGAKDAAWREAAAPPVPQEQIVAMADFIRALKKSLAKTEIRSKDAKVLAGTEIELGPPVVAAFVMPAIAASRESAMRVQSMNNLKQIGLAMHNYASAQKHLPPAAIRSKDGKPLLSWRVAILPYLEQNSIYSQFHLDEPWDSEHNKKLLDKMPPQLRDPHEPAGSTNASYFMLTGKGTIGETAEGTRLKDILDGTSKTIMVVDAKRDIPWTKPEDIEIFDPGMPLPKFGGNSEGGVIAAAFADGSVQTISQQIDPAFLRAMLSIAGGEVISAEGVVPNRAQPPAPVAQPPASDGFRPQKSSSIQLKNGENGKLAIEANGKPIDQDQLNKLFVAAAKDNELIVILADKNIAYKEILPIVKAAETAGAKIQLAGTGEKVGAITEAEIPGFGTAASKQPNAPAAARRKSVAVIVTKDGIADATAVKDEIGQPAVSILFTPTQAEKMQQLSRTKEDKVLVVNANGKTVGYIHFNASQAISDKVLLTGTMREEEAEQIARELRGK